MRWRWIVVGFVGVGAALGCATAESVPSGGKADGGGAAGASATGGTAGASGGAAGGGGLGGSSGSSGGTAGTDGGSCTPPTSSGECDTFPQCGCDAGQACNVADQKGTTSCGPPGNVTAYNACAAATDCIQGYACVGSACKAFCQIDSDCSQTGGICFEVKDTGGNPIPGMKVCSKKCQLENPAAACGPGLNCVVDKSDQTDCNKAGTATGTGACATDPDACAPGYGCLQGGDCQKWCRVGFSDCGGGSCGGFTTPLIVDGLEYGVCP